MAIDYSELKNLIDNPNFDPEKFKQVLHHIICSTACLSNVGKTVLYKLLYFSDFDFYELNESFLTGERYSKIDHGPAPRHFNEMIEELEREGKIQVVTTTYFGRSQTRFISLISPEYSKLNADELKHIDRTLGKYASMNATQIKAISHDDIPYKATNEKRDIDYELVFYRDARTSVREYMDD